MISKQRISRWHEEWDRLFSYFNKGGESLDNDLFSLFAGGGQEPVDPFVRQLLLKQVMAFLLGKLFMDVSMFLLAHCEYIYRKDPYWICLTEQDRKLQENDMFELFKTSYWYWLGCRQQTTASQMRSLALCLLQKDRLSAILNVRALYELTSSTARCFWDYADMTRDTTELFDFLRWRNAWQIHYSFLHIDRASLPDAEGKILLDAYRKTQKERKSRRISTDIEHMLKLVCKEWDWKGTIPTGIYSYLSGIAHDPELLIKPYPKEGRELVANSNAHDEYLFAISLALIPAFAHFAVLRRNGLLNPLPSCCQWGCLCQLCAVTKVCQELGWLSFIDTSQITKLAGSPGKCGDEDDCLWRAVIGYAPETDFTVNLCAIRDQIKKECMKSEKKDDESPSQKIKPTE